MKTITTTTDVYQFNELSESAKETAREWYLKGFDFEPHSESVREDAMEIGKLFGLDIKKIYFSGFWSQGDGACLEGFYSYKPGGLKAAKSYAPKDEKLHQIVKELQEIQRKNFYKISAGIRHSGYYMHSGCTDINVEGAADNTEVIDALRSFMDWIYKRLEQEYEYQTSNEAVDESIISNEYEFTEDGHKY